MLAAVQARPQARSQQPASVSKAVRRILVVDDDECMRELLYLHLTGSGYEVELAEDGIAAGHAVLRAIPDLMLVDVDMPYMSGLDLVAAIRADLSIPRFPVVFLTAVTNLAERARALGAAYVTKPIRADTLLAVVSRQGRAANGSS